MTDQEEGGNKVESETVKMGNHNHVEDKHGYGQCGPLEGVQMKTLIFLLILCNQIEMTHGENNLHKQSLIIGIVKVLAIIAILIAFMLFIFKIIKTCCFKKSENIDIESINKKVKATIKAQLQNINELKPENVKKYQKIIKHKKNKKKAPTNIKYTKIAGGGTTVIIEDIGEDLEADNNVGCKICAAYFANQFSLFAHERNKHNFFRCFMCQYTSMSMHNLLKHFEDKHVQHCAYCGQYFPKKDALINHKNEHTAKSFDNLQPGTSTATLFSQGTFSLY